MPQDSKFSNTFIESLVSLKEEERLQYLQHIFQTPEKVRALVFAPETSSFIRGLLRSYDVPGNSIDAVPLSIIRIFVGEKSLAQLPAILSTELKLPNDKAQKMAAEIEKDVFGPVKAELDEFLSRKVASQPRDAVARKSLQNVLNLKELPAPTSPLGLRGAGRKVQTQLPGKPAQKDFPVRTSEANKQPPRAPLRPLGFAGQAGGGTAPKPRFPLPPKTQNPIRFT